MSLPIHHQHSNPYKALPSTDYSEHVNPIKSRVKKAIVAVVFLVVALLGLLWWWTLSDVDVPIKSSPSIEQEDPFASVREYEYVIIVFAYQRRASLKRLCDSLVNARYHSIPVKLEFRVEGEAHPRVLEFIKEFKWPHGPLQVHYSPIRKGLQRNIIEAWRPYETTRVNQSSAVDQFAFFFEDDIEVAPGFFEFALLGLKQYIVPGSDSHSWAKHVIGISLNTPKFNEVDPQPSLWRPTDLIGPKPGLFLFQLPCSWGALYFPWWWDRFLQYYYWRQTVEDHSVEVLPYSAVNSWTRSWKRFLVEFMYLHGLVMLYPNLPDQKSFSTHHREPGEHTKGEGEIALVDQLTTQKWDFFTVALVEEEGTPWLIFHDALPLRYLPIINLHHRLVFSLSELRQSGMWSAVQLIPLGYDWVRWLEGSDKSTGMCVLDLLEPLIKRYSTLDGSCSGNLLYVPQGNSLYSQLDQLECAIGLALALNRTLIIPPLVINQPDQFYLPLHHVKELPNETWFIDGYDSGEVLNRNVMRVISLDPLSDEPAPEQKLLFLAKNNISPTALVTVSAYIDSIQGFQSFFSGCTDRTLAFLSLQIMAMEQQQKLFLAFSELYRTRIKSILYQGTLAAHPHLPGSINCCLVFARTECPNQPPGPTEADRLLYYRSCQASPIKLIDYAREMLGLVNEQNSPLSCHIFIDVEPIHEVLNLDKSLLDEMSSVVQSDSARHLKILKSERVAKTLQANLMSLSSLSRLTEALTCVQTTHFIGNVYSPWTRWISNQRSLFFDNKKSHMFGIPGPIIPKDITDRRN